jgi:hypothetical protein
MAIPFSYTLRNLLARRVTTLLTAGGMGLVVFVFAAVLMLEEGLKQTLVQTGSMDNVVAIRRAAQTEVQSAIDRTQAAIIENQPEIALDRSGQLLVSKETVVLINLKKRDSLAPANVMIRGVAPVGVVGLRPQVHIVEGRAFKPGSAEIITGRSVADRFQGAALGQRLRFAGREWTVVGVFESDKSGFESEVWGDVEQLMQSFRRPVYSSMVFKLRSESDFAIIKARIESDPRLSVELKPEGLYYEDQSRLLANFIKYLGLTLSVIFSLGAVIGATITMYASVASRTAEIGTLRALGFTRSNVLWAFLFEAMLLGGAGGVLGLGLASFMQFFTISTMNWQSFSELAFRFILTPSIGLKSMGFALIMGAVGGFLPSLRAARMNIVTALRSA